MTTPAGWNQEQTNLYTTNSFTFSKASGVNYQMKVNTQTGGMDLYVQSTTGNKLFARSGAGNNLTLISDGQNAFINSLPPSERTNLTSASAVSQYLATNVSLQANTYRANLVKSVVPNASSTFTTMPGVGTAQASSPVATPSTAATTAGSGGLLGAAQAAADVLTDPFAAAGSVNFNSSNDAQLFSSFLLKYPQDLLETKQDTIVIQQFKYAAPNADFLTQDNLSNIITTGLSRNQNLTENLGTVVLPIPQGIQDSNNVEWGGDTMNNLSSAAASSVANNLPNYAGAMGIGAAVGAVLGGGAGGGAKTGAALTLQNALLNEVGKSGNLKTLFGAGLVSTITGAAGYEVPAESLLARGYGIAPNSNLELLFSGPTLRQFTFSYRMSPRNETEAKAVRNIIRFFKQGMAPRKQNTSSGSAASFFLGAPNVFKLKYTYDGTNQIKGLNRFKTCALTGFSVNYAPDGQWASYDGKDPGQPVSVIINMSFNELDPVYNTDYNATSDDEVGF